VELDEEADAGAEDDLVELGGLEEGVVVDLLDEEQDDLHEVVEAQVLLRLLIRLDDELEDLL